MRYIKPLLIVTGLCLLAAIGFAAWLAWYASSPLSLKLNPQGVVGFDVRPGLGLKAAAREMEQAGIGVSPDWFSLIGRISGRDRSIQAGSYEVGPGVTAWQLLEKLTAGDVTQASITIVEGWTFRQMRQLIDSHPDLRRDTTGWTDAEILRHIGADISHPEGWFFPDTYLFPKQSSDLTIYRRAHEAMRRRLAAAWEGRNPAVPYRNKTEALIMASIVEKETALPGDRGKVASVFVNRLRINMRLQTDPTVIYGMGERFDGNLRRRDLETDTPYNTYTRAGLPPTPIALPGMAAIEATLNPPETGYFYFVSKGREGRGGSVFSHTLEEHNRAVNKYQRGRG